MELHVSGDGLASGGVRAQACSSCGDECWDQGSTGEKSKLPDVAGHCNRLFFGQEPSWTHLSMALSLERTETGKSRYKRGTICRSSTESAGASLAGHGLCERLPLPWGQKRRNVNVPSGAGDWGCDRKELENWKPGSTPRESCLQKSLHVLTPLWRHSPGVHKTTSHCWLAAPSPSSRINITSWRMDEMDPKKIIDQNVMTRLTTLWRTRFTRSSMSCVILVKLVNTWSPPFLICKMGQKAILICRVVTIRDAPCKMPARRLAICWVRSKCSVFYHSTTHRERNILRWLKASTLQFDHLASSLTAGNSSGPQFSYLGNRKSASHLIANLLKVVRWMKWVSMKCLRECQCTVSAL